MSAINTRLHIVSAMDSLDQLGGSILSANLPFADTEGMIKQLRDVRASLHDALKAIGDTPVAMPDQVSALAAEVEMLMAAPVPGSNVVQLGDRR